MILFVSVEYGVVNKKWVKKIMHMFTLDKRVRLGLRCIDPFNKRVGLGLSGFNLFIGEPDTNLIRHDSLPAENSIVYREKSERVSH